MRVLTLVNIRHLASQFFSGKPGIISNSFCLSCTFIFRNERNWMKKSARVSEKLVSKGLPGLQVATRLNMVHFNSVVFGVIAGTTEQWGRGGGGHMPPNIFKIIKS